MTEIRAQRLLEIRSRALVNFDTTCGAASAGIVDPLANLGLVGAHEQPAFGDGLRARIEKARELLLAEDDEMVDDEREERPAKKQSGAHGNPVMGEPIRVPIERVEAYRRSRARPRFQSLEPSLNLIALVSQEIQRRLRV